SCLYGTIAETYGRRVVKAPMRIDEESDIRPRRLADQRGQFGRFPLILAGHRAIEIALGLLARNALGIKRTLLGEGVEFERSVPRGDDVPDFPLHALLAGELALIGMGIEEDVVAHRPGEQLVDRLAQDRAPDIPQRNVDGADAFHRRAAAAQIGEIAEDLVPDPFDLAGVVTLDDLADLFQHHREGAIGDEGGGGDLAPAGDASVGRHFDKQKLAPIGRSRPDQPRFDAGDFHFPLPRSGARRFCQLARAASAARICSTMCLPDPSTCWATSAAALSASPSLISWIS